MGCFGTFVYTDGRWARDADVPAAGAYLRLDIHDSDIAQVDFRPNGPGAGRFYLGFVPAAYFDDPGASRPVDADAEVTGFISWIQQVAGAEVAADQVRPLLGDPDGGDPDGGDPEEVFAEETVITLLSLAGLPVPRGLQGDA